MVSLAPLWPPGAGTLGSSQCLLVPYCTEVAVPAAGGHPKPRIPLRLPGLGPSRGLWVRCRAQLTFPVTPAARQGREEGTRSSFLSFTPWAQLFPHRSKGKAKMQPAMTPSFTPLPFYFTSPNGVGGTKQSPALFDGLILEPSMLGSNACLTASEERGALRPLSHRGAWQSPSWHIPHAHQRNSQAASATPHVHRKGKRKVLSMRRLPKRN